MHIELITKDDLKNFRDEIINEVSSLIKGNGDRKEWLKSKEVRQMLNCSTGTLHHLRVSGTLPFTKVGGTTYYSYAEVVKMMNGNKKNAS